MEVDLLVEGYIARWREISRTNQEVAHPLAERVGDKSSRLPGCNWFLGELLRCRNALGPVVRHPASDTELELGPELGILLHILANGCVPLGLVLLTTGTYVFEEVVDILGNLVKLLRVEAEGGLNAGNIIDTQSSTMGLGTASLVRAESDSCPDVNKRRLLSRLARSNEGISDG